MKRSKFPEEQIAYALRQVEDENRRLKQLVADLTLDKHVLSEALRKNLKPARHRELTTWFRDTVRISTVRACRLAHLSRTGWYGRHWIAPHRL